MSTKPDGLQLAYVSTLEAYLHAGGESALSDAYELGRRALAQGLGVLDMALLHGSAFEQLVLSAPVGDQPRLAHAATDIFRELLSLFEMTFRGYRDANIELQRLNEVLRQQKEQLEATNRELEAFSYSASHDLRNPLGAIEGLSSLLLLRSGNALDDSGRHHLGLIQESARQMRQLIEDLMSLARVNRSELQLVDVDVGTLAREILTRLSEASPGRATHIEVREGIYAVADRNLLSIALENLLGNAWKFTSSAPARTSRSAARSTAGNWSTSSGTTAPASTWPRPTSSSRRSSASTPRAISKAPESG
jgi:signal transduction histidine kinase